MARYIAFAGDPEVRRTLLSRLDEHRAGGSLDHGGGRWTGTGGTASGCIAASGDLKAFEAATGYPGGLGLLLDYLCARIDDPQDAERLASDWLGRVAPGTDLTGVPGRLVALMLADALDGEAWADDLQGVSEVLRAILALQRRATVGDTPSRADWSAAQAAAITATDAIPDPLGQAFGALAEAAAWDPLISRSTLTDTAAKWCSLRAFRASRATGWTDQDEAAFRACTETFERDVLAHDPTLRSYDFPSFFSAHEPELCARFMKQLDHSNRAFLEAPEVLARWGLDSLAAHTEPEA